MQPLHLVNPRYVVLQGLSVRNGFPHGINIDDGGDYSSPAEHIILRDMEIRDVGMGGNSDCLKMSGVDNFHILDSEFSNCNQGEAIDMVGCHDGVVAGNYFHDIVLNAVQTKGGSADVLIHGNRFVDVTARAINAGGSTGLQYFRPIDATHEAARIRMTGNLFLRTNNAAVAFVGCDTCVFAHNTIVEPSGYVARILEEQTARGPGSNGQFINNIVVFNTADLGSTPVNVGGGTLPGSFTFGWNLWYALDDAGYSGPTYFGGLPAEQGSVIQQDPVFVNRAGGDYHLQAGSPAIAQATSVPGGVLADFDGRDYADPAAIGAFAAP
jgi:hypothetical protein